MEKVISRNKNIALIGALSALVVVLGITRLGFLSLSPTVSLTIIHIPVILCAFLAGLPGGIVCGAVFGIFSLVQGAINPTGALDPLFVNPLVSVLPRMLFGAAAWGLFKIISFIPKIPRGITAGVAAFLSTLMHTCLVIGAIYGFYFSAASEAMGGIGYIAALLLLLPNAVTEALAATIVCVAVITATSISGKHKKSKISQGK